MEYKIGDKVKIINEDRHGFKKDTIVEIIEIPCKPEDLYILRGMVYDGSMNDQYLYQYQFSRIEKEIIKDCESSQEETTAEKILKLFSSEELLTEINRRMK